LHVSFASVTSEQALKEITTMQTNYQARWISRKRLEELRRSGVYRNALLLDHFNGLLVIEPVGSELGDGTVLSPQEAEYELQPAWLLGPRGQVSEARRRLGLEAGPPVAVPRTPPRTAARPAAVTSRRTPS
jgi:hypothetical protein